MKSHQKKANKAILFMTLGTLSIYSICWKKVSLFYNFFKAPSKFNLIFFIFIT